MSQAASRRPYIPECAHVAGQFLSDLRGAHRSLLGEMENLDSLTREPAFDAMRCMSIRWKISQASLRRRTLAARIHDYLLTRGSTEEAAVVGALQKADQLLLRVSASHVGTWNAEAIGKDWPGYCAASRQVRQHMHAQIGEDQRVLYPLLAKLAART